MLPVFTIGYGKRTLEDFLATLVRRKIRYLIDVRSNPRSSYRPEFSHQELRKSLKHAGISYVPMGDTLGGRPRDPSCYKGGRVLYEEVRERRFFQVGIRRVEAALREGLRVCLMCSEGRPEECHRSKLIGVALDSLGVQVIHIGAGEEDIPQKEVLAKLAAPQGNLFGQEHISRRVYKSSKAPSEPA